MEKNKGNMLIAHGGGPTPVINSSLRGVIVQAWASGFTGAVFGARFGAEGILKKDVINLDRWTKDDVKRLSSTPASALGSCRRKITENDYERVLECFREFDIRYFFYNGGNDSMDTCDKIHALAEKTGYDMRVIGIPKTIDNDLTGTDHSPGYGSAARFAAFAALEVAMDAASLPIHVVVMEMMGRNAGWLTAAATPFAGAMPCEHLVYLPERALDAACFLSDVRAAFGKKHGLLVTVSEGLRGADGAMYGDSGIKDGFGHTIPGGAAQCLSNLIVQETGLKSRSEKPGLLGRVSMAHISAVDAAEAYDAGAFAVLSALRGESGYMVGIEAERGEAYRYSMKLHPLSQAANAEKKFPLEWINAEGGAVKQDFRDYCLPLIGADIPHYTHIL